MPFQNVLKDDDTIAGSANGTVNDVAGNGMPLGGGEEGLWTWTVLSKPSSNRFYLLRVREDCLICLNRVGWDSQLAVAVSASAATFK